MAASRNALLLLQTAFLFTGTSSLSVPLQQGAGKLSRDLVASRHAIRSTGTAATSLSAGLWYGSFDVGDAKGLSLSLSTGSNFPVVNPGLYQPSADAVDVNRTGWFTYYTMEKDGCGFANLTWEAYQDTVTFAGLTVEHLQLADVQYKPAPGPGYYTQFAGQGLMGLAMDLDVAPGDPSTYFSSLCNQNVLDECRFGMAFGFDGAGEMIVGSDTESMHGELSTTSAAADWMASGKLVINGTDILAEHDDIYYDSATVNIVLDTATAQKLFAALGLQTVVLNHPGCTPITYAFYPCDAPPTVGFQVGDKVFNIDPSQFQLEDNGNNNCTAIITGIDYPYPWWLVGQAWFQGKYVDFDGTGVKDNKYAVGVAMLN